MKTKILKTGRTEAQVTQQVLQAAALFGIELKRRNVGGMYNAYGQYVAFGDLGDADYYCVLPDGRYMSVELKEEDFDPSKLSGAERIRFERQLAELRKVNASNGVGFWVDNVDLFITVMRFVLDGGRVEETGAGGLYVISRGYIKEA